MEEAVISYPFGPVDSQSVDSAADLTIEVLNQKTIVSVSEMAQNTTLNLSINPDLNAGAELIVTAKSDATARTITFGNGITGVPVVGVIGKTKVITLVYDGVTFIHTSTNQID